MKELDNPPATEASQVDASPEAKLASAPAEAAPAQTVDELDNIDFLLEEIENKIAPLALA